MLQGPWARKSHAARKLYSVPNTPSLPICFTAMYLCHACSGRDSRPYHLDGMPRTACPGQECSSTGYKCLSVLARQRFTAASRFGFSNAAATRSLSFSCLFVASSVECVPGVTLISTCPPQTNRLGPALLHITIRVQTSIHMEHMVL